MPANKLLHRRSGKPPSATAAGPCMPSRWGTTARVVVPISARPARISSRVTAARQAGELQKASACTKLILAVSEKAGAHALAFFDLSKIRMVLHCADAYDTPVSTITIAKPLRYIGLPEEIANEARQTLRDRFGHD